MNSFRSWKKLSERYRNPIPKVFTTVHTIHTVFLQERNIKSDIEHIPCEIIKSSFIFLTIFLQERNSKKSEARCFPLSSMFFTFIHYLQHRLYSLHILTTFKSKRKNEARCFLFVFHVTYFHSQTTTSFILTSHSY